MFCKEVGVPQSLLVDPSGDRSSNKVKKLYHQVGTSLRIISLRIIEEPPKWANRANLYIGLFKEAIRKDMREANIPLVFWDYTVLTGGPSHVNSLLENSSNSKERRQSRQSWVHKAIFSQLPNISGMISVTLESQETINSHSNIIINYDVC